MKDQVTLFRELHHQEEPLVIGNAWNVQSARVLEKLAFKAIATSSAAVAETIGYRDGENMPFEEYFFIIRKIKESVKAPLSVDLEAGYGKTEEDIVNNLKRLHEIGISGINLEDSDIKSSGREIANADSFARKLQNITSQLKHQQIDIFINVRCDAFLLKVPDARKEAIKRIGLYQQTGADGIFLPCITDVDDIKETVAAAKLPVNVMCMPALPDFAVLKSLGVKRISMGNFLNNSVYNKMEELAANVIREGSFNRLFQ